MRGIDIATVPVRTRSGYPAPFGAPCADRTRRRLGNAGGLRDFGVNLMTLPPGGWSSQRHWHCESDVDMMSSNADGRFVRKDGSAFP